MKTKHSWKTPNSNNVNNVEKVGNISVTREILEDSIYMTKGIEEYIKNDEQYALLKLLKNVRDYDKIIVNGLDDSKKNIILCGQKSDGTAENFVVNDWKSLFDDDTNDILTDLKMEYLMRYECDTTFEPCGTAREIFGTDDDTPMCFMVMNRKEK